jgi:integrase
MPRKRLDNRTIKAAIRNASEVGKRVDYWDTTVEGLGCRVEPTGRAAFFVRYRVAGRQRRLRLGTFGPMTVDQARKVAGQARVDVERGADLQAMRSEARGGLLLADAFVRFMGEPGKRGDRKPSTVRVYRQIFRDHLAPKLGRTRVDAIERRDVERVKVAAAEAGQVMANRTLAVLSAILGAAERWGELPMGSNPCRGVDRYKERGRERFLRPEERAALEAVLIDAEQRPDSSPGSITAGAALCIRLLALTGARLSEMTGLRWGMVDLDRSCLRLPDSKTGAKVVPLAPQAVELLREQRPDEPTVDALVCPNTRGNELNNMGRVWGRIRAAAGLEDVRGHDLRHSWASDALNAGVPLAHVGAVLGHNTQAATQRYAHVEDDALRRSLAMAGDAIEAATRDGAKVARLSTASSAAHRESKRRRG